MATATTKTASRASKATASADPILVDLGRHKKKRIKKLRKGGGPLLDIVHSSLDELKSQGHVAENAQPVIVVVREKEEKDSWSLI